MFLSMRLSVHSIVVIRALPLSATHDVTIFGIDDTVVSQTTWTSLQCHATILASLDWRICTIDPVQIDAVCLTLDAPFDKGASRSPRVSKTSAHSSSIMWKCVLHMSTLGMYGPY